MHELPPPGLTQRAPNRTDPAPGRGMAELFARFDWAGTPLGPMAAWPPVLKTTAGIMLRSPLPIAVLWGPEGILLYNEGYAVIAGARHPSVLGSRALESWPEVASLNQRVMDICLAGAPLSLREEFMILLRNGFPEEVWLDVDYSPIPGPDGDILGVFAVVNDVTSRVRAERARRETENQLALAIAAADLGTWDYDIVQDRKYQSARTREMFGIPAEETVSQPDFYMGLHPQDREAVTAAFARSTDPEIRAPFDIEYRVIGARDGVVRWIASKGRAYFDDAGTPLRIAGTALEITERKSAERRQACLAELSERLRALDTTAEIAGAAAEILGRTLAGTRAGYAVVDGDHTLIEADWTNGEAVSLVGPRLFSALGQAFTAPLMRGQALAINDVETHPATAAVKDNFARIHVRALLNIPLLEDGRITALLYVHDARPRQWTPGDVELLQDMAGRTWEAAARAKALQKLRGLNERLEQEVAIRTAQRDRIWRLSSDVMLVADFAGRIESVNPAWRALLGWSEDELIGRELAELSHPEDRAGMQSALLRGTGARPVTKYEGRLRKRNGACLWLSWRAVADDRAIHAVGRDMTAEREQAAALQAAEEALRQAQKMEAVGQLTGGIAHDFNNLLQGITGSLDLVEKRLADGRAIEAHRFVAAARASANRAVSLTHRLLAFSRRQPLNPKPVEANPLIASMLELLRQSLGERVEIALDFAADLWLTLCDPHQLESAILNLAINARDAMPDGGRLTIRTANIETDGSRAAELKPGAYVSVSVADTGTGMPASVREQAFEPFYTTKPLGQGTGLGLSMIYGFARQSGGHASIASELGRGTEVTLFLPRYSGVAAAEDEEKMKVLGPAATRHATVLVVEDEEIVRALVFEVLSELGLDVLEAGSGPLGLEILQGRRKIDLLVTDIGLPGLNGRQMADAARLARPGLKVLFMTGYAENAASASGFLEPGMSMITKPFVIDDLVAKIQGMLEE